jgi:hypothetical protein
VPARKKLSLVTNRFESRGAGATAALGAEVADRCCGDGFTCAVWARERAGATATTINLAALAYFMKACLPVLCELHSVIEPTAAFNFPIAACCAALKNH